MAAKAGMAVGGLILIVLLAGIFGGDKSVHDFGNALYNTAHWTGHWIGKTGHWVGETWQSFFRHGDKKTSAGI